MKIGLIGAGNIGRAIYEKLRALKLDIRFVVKDDGFYADMENKVGGLDEWREYCNSHVSMNADVVFLSIPTFDDGETEYGYIKFFLEKKIPVITCAKGALSNFWLELEQWIDLIGYSATVGGGTLLLQYLKSRVSSDTDEVGAVINGTVNYFFSEISSGRSLWEVAEDAKRLGYTEPGAQDPLEILNKEITSDIPKKAAIIMNSSNLATHYGRVKAREIKVNKVTEDELKELIRNAGKFRYIVSFRKKNHEKPCIGGFTHQVGEWIISGGFKEIGSDPLYGKLIVGGINNAIVIRQGEYGKGGTYTLQGEGAGSGAVVDAMMVNFRDFYIVKMNGGK